MVLKQSISDVQVEEDNTSSLLANVKVFQRCNFCQKESNTYWRTQLLIQNLTQSKKFYCRFCIEHDYHTKKSKNILILSYRGIISYLYYNSYFYNKESKLYLSQIQDMIENHTKIGQQNPIFVYDPETFCWFIDFAKVGTKGRRVSIDDIIDNINKILIAFNLYDNIENFKGYKLCEKFKEAILDFYNKRYRPPNKKLLIPTLSGCILPEPTKKINLEYRDFVYSNLVLNPRK